VTVAEPPAVPPRPEQEGGHYDAFVSYQRGDLPAVERVRDALRERGKLVWMDVDYDNIPPGTRWEDRINRGIEACKAFIFVISHGSTKSDACGGEIADAVALHKLIIPVVHEYVEPSQLPAVIAQTQWIDLRDGETWDAGIDKLVEALETDVAWRDQHTRYAGLAREWLDHDHDGSYLLRGSDLTNAEAWLAEQGGHRTQPTAEQREYVVRSRQAAVRRQRILVGGLSAGLVIATALAVFALIQRATAVRETDAARSQLRAARALTLASSAERLAPSRPDESLLMALEANRLEPSLVQARSIMTSDLEAVRESGLEAVLGPTAPANPASPATAIAYSSNGELLATGDDDGLVSLYDVPERRLLATVPNGRDQDAVNSLAFAPDGTLLATAGAKGMVRLFTVSGRGLALLDTVAANHDAVGQDNPTPVSGEFGSGVNGLAFSPAGTTLVTAGHDGDVRLFSVSRRGLALRQTVTAGDAYDSVTSVAFAPSGRAIAAGIGSGIVQLIGVADDRLKVRAEIDGTEPALTGPIAASAVAFSPGGALLAVGGEDGDVQLVRVARDELSPLGGPHSASDDRDLSGYGSVDAVTFDPDGTALASGSIDGTLRLFVVAHGTLAPRAVPSAVQTSGDGVDALAFAPGGTTLAAAGEDGIVRLLGVAGGRLLGAPEVDQDGQGTKRLSFSPNSRTLAAGDSDGKVRLFTFARRALSLAHTMPADGAADQLGSGVTAVAFGPSGATLATGSGDGQVRLFGLSHGTPTLLAHVPAASAADGGVSGVAFEDAGATLVTSSGASVRVFDVSDGHLSPASTSDPAGQNAEFLSLAAAPPSSMLALYDGQPVLAAISHQKVVPVQSVSPPEAASFAEAVALGDGGTELAVAADDETLLYRISHDRASLISSASTSDGYSVAFAPDGSTLAVGTQEDGTAVFSISGGTLALLGTAPASGTVDSVAFAPNGTAVAVGLDSGGVQLLDIVWPDYGYLQSQVCSLVWRNFSSSEWSSLSPPGLRKPSACAP
jgi:WD40 repeat protein